MYELWAGSSSALTATGKKALREKPVPATLPTTNPTRTGLGSNPDLHGDQLLTYGMAIMYRLCSMILLLQKSIKPLLG
jgi:hypothetical protein